MKIEGTSKQIQDKNPEVLLQLLLPRNPADKELSLIRVHGGSSKENSSQRETEEKLSNDPTRTIPKN